MAAYGCKLYMCGDKFKRIAQALLSKNGSCNRLMLNVMHRKRVRINKDPKEISLRLRSLYHDTDAMLVLRKESGPKEES